MKVKLLVVETAGNWEVQLVVTTAVEKEESSAVLKDN